MRLKLLPPTSALHHRNRAITDSHDEGTPHPDGKLTRLRPHSEIPSRNASRHLIRSSPSTASRTTSEISRCVHPFPPTLHTYSGPHHTLQVTRPPTPNLDPPSLPSPSPPPTPQLPTSPHAALLCTYLLPFRFLSLSAADNRPEPGYLFPLCYK